MKTLFRTIKKLRYSLFSRHFSLKKGFTLIELLIVITIIAILAAIVFVAIDPAKRFSQARNTQRWSEVTSIASAVLQYAVDNDGDYPGGVDTNLRQLGTATSGCDSPFCLEVGDLASSCLNLSGYLVDDYLASIPYDPKTGSSEKTRYAIKKTASGRITVIACDAELTQAIKISR